MNKYISFLMPSMLVVLFSFTARNKLKIDGAWKVVEVRTVKPDGTFTSVYPSESQVIFADSHYSFCWTSHRSSVHNWQIPDSAKLIRMNRSIINAGTYTLKDSILTTKATFALNPMFTGGIAEFKCNSKGDTLILEGINVVSSDNIQNPIYASGSNFITKLVQIKGL